MLNLFLLWNFFKKNVKNTSSRNGSHVSAQLSTRGAVGTSYLVTNMMIDICAIKCGEITIIF